MSEAWAIAIFTAAIGVLSIFVGWLVVVVIDLKGKLAVVEASHVEIKGSLLTSEGVRKVVEQALAARDAVAFERRRDWDERLTLKIAGAVSEGFSKCQAETRAELERAVPRIVREVLSTRATPKPH